ncbi:MAG: 2,3-bisphosphoglycerate-independent phosphoglycerate mutase [Firmicutes bacterium]|nr:2,3-bisphosphoglycerate-independent phosphoglycerate mutase [Bacillota bacterium]
MKFAGKPLMLMILDGWGMRQGGPADATALADVSNFDRLWANYPHCQLQASGGNVGLPDGQMGDSEVGHMNIGAGRIMYQDFTKINKEIAEGNFFKNQAFLDACRAAVENHGALHLMGLTSDGGIHSHITHLFALLQLAKMENVPEVYVHCFTDGRDTANAIAGRFVAQLEERLTGFPRGRIATVMGRFYAMDRDKRWDRVRRAYQAMVYGEGHQAASAGEAVELSYQRGQTDEFIEPTVIMEDGKPAGLVKDGDSVIFFNYRSDRAREISHVFTDSHFDFFDRGAGFPHVHYVCLTNYDDALVNADIAYPPHPPQNTFGRTLAKNGLRQLRIAETEKYAHVTFFFNGGVEKMEAGEDRVMIPSPNVKTYDLQPRMSAAAVTNALVDRIRSGIYDVIIVNFANPDMLGHTGDIKATVQALEYVDQCLGRLEEEIREAGGTLLITADHGNVEKMVENGLPMTSHTTNPVPFIVVDDNMRYLHLRDGGKLEDIAPTMLQLLGLRQPEEMTGRSLIDQGLKQFDQLELFA